MYINDILDRKKTLKRREQKLNNNYTTTININNLGLPVLNRSQNQFINTNLLSYFVWSEVNIKDKYVSVSFYYIFNVRGTNHIHVTIRRFLSSIHDLWYMIWLELSLDMKVFNSFVVSPSRAISPPTVTSISTRIPKANRICSAVKNRNVDILALR